MWRLVGGQAAAAAAAAAMSRSVLPSLTSLDYNSAAMLRATACKMAGGQVARAVGLHPRSHCGPRRPVARDLRTSSSTNDAAAGGETSAAVPLPPVLYPPPADAANALEQQQRDTPPQPSSQPLSSQLQGLGYLLFVALLWGSYTPALRCAPAAARPSRADLPASSTKLCLPCALLTPCAASPHGLRRLAYSMPGPPTPTALTAASAVVELAVLLAAAALAPRPAAPAAAAAAAAAEPGGSQAEPALPPLPLGLPAAAAAGLEIGLYNTAASFAQISGLALTTATRGAFLVQASSLFTPLLSSWAGMVPGRRAVWAAWWLCGGLLAASGWAPHAAR